jgi:hypothetical protein
MPPRETPPPLPLEEHISGSPPPLTLLEHVSNEEGGTTTNNHNREEFHTPHLLPSLFHSSSGSDLEHFARVHRRTSEHVPLGYQVYDRCYLNHLKYGRMIHLGGGKRHYPHYIRFKHNYQEPQHYVHGKRADEDSDAPVYGWTLEAMNSSEDSLPGVDEERLTLLDPYSPDHAKVDIALYALDDQGVLADVDRWRGLVMDKQEIDNEQ